MIELPPMERVRWLDVLNTTAEQIPAFAPMRVTDMDTATRLIKVGKANADGAGLYLFNGPQPIAANGNGLGTRSFPAVAYYDSGDGTPANGETWGPGNASWKLRKNETGYKVHGLVVSGSFMMVEPQYVAEASAVFSGARVYHSNAAAQSVSSGGSLYVVFDSEQFDTDAYHSTSSNTSRLTVPTTGYYLVGATVHWGTGSGDTFSLNLQIDKNRSATLARNQMGPTVATDATATTQEAAAIASLTAGDYVEVQVYHGSGSSETILNTGLFPYFWIAKIG